MEEASVLWSKLELDHPPNSSWCSNTQNFDVNRLRGILNKILQDDEAQPLLYTEAAILSRLIYRMKSKFRRDKGLQNMEKMNRVLLNYCKLNIVTEFKFLQKSIEVESASSIILPSRQMLEYVLVRIQGFSKLMERLELVSKNAATFFLGRITIGHAWTISIVAYAVISRIWVLSRYYLKKSCMWYEDLFPYLRKLQPVGIRWLPKGYKLPENLKSWLSLPWIDEELKTIPTHEDWSQAMYKLIRTEKDDSDEEMTTNFEIEDLSKEVSVTEHKIKKRILNCSTGVSETATKSSLCSPDIESLDFGEPISREDFETGKIEKSSAAPDLVPATSKSKSKKSSSMNLKQKVQNINDIKTISDLETLLSAEYYPGVDKLRWNIIQKHGKKLLRKCQRVNEVKQKVLIGKAIQQISEWIV